jgi:hypothetical protein
MDIEFHYWITGIIARESGFTEDEAKKIAYSSQFVDENDTSLTIKDKEKKKEYRNFISQTLNILKPKTELLRIYPIFHFIPGHPEADTAKRRDGKMHLFNTTPNSEFANKILQKSFKAKQDVRLYRIGIATHGFVDTWAHQNFTGWHEAFNAVGLNPIPNIGHADAQHHPDWVGHRWLDDRLVDGEINNNHRFLSAAKELFTHYCDYLFSAGRYQGDKGPKWPRVQKLLLKLMGSASSGDLNYGREERVSSYKEYADWLPEFDEAVWFDEAIDTRVRGLKDSKSSIFAELTVFKDEYFWKADTDKTFTHWFKFQKAVKQHERYALKQISPYFRQIGIDLTRA